MELPLVNTSVHLTARKDFAGCRKMWQLHLRMLLGVMRRLSRWRHIEDFADKRRDKNCALYPAQNIHGKVHVWAGMVQLMHVFLIMDILPNS